MIRTLPLTARFLSPSQPDTFLPAKQAENFVLPRSANVVGLGRRSSQVKAMGRGISGSRFVSRPWRRGMIFPPPPPTPPPLGLMIVEPIKVLPNFTFYNRNTDLVEIIPGDPMDKPWAPPGLGFITNITSAGALQTEINFRAGFTTGWTIVVATSVITNGFNLPPRPSINSDDIYVISSDDAMLPNPTYTGHGRTTGGSAHRAKPSHAPHMWKFRTAAGQHAISVSSAPNVCHYVVSGFDFAPVNATSKVHTPFELGPNSNRNDLNVYPRHIVLDRFYIHDAGNFMAFGIHHAIVNEAGWSKIQNGYIEGVADDQSAESKAVLTLNSPGPQAFLNLFLEAAGENVFIGGHDPEPPGHVPGNIFYDFVHLFKRPQWNPKHPLFDNTYTSAVKNNWEMKMGYNICVQRFVTEGCWFGGQVGIAIVPKTTNQKPAGEPDSPSNPGNHVFSRDVTYRHFMIVNTYGGFGMTGLTQRGNYADEQVSRPQEFDVHSGIIALGPKSIYGPTGGSTVWHSQVICQSMNKNYRLKRLIGVCEDMPRGAWDFTGEPGDESNNVQCEDSLFMFGDWLQNGSPANPSAYKGDGGTSPIGPANEGQGVINGYIIGAQWSRVALYGNPGAAFTPTQLSELTAVHVKVLQNTNASDVFTSYNPADLFSSDMSIKHPDLANLGEGGTPLGPDTVALMQHLNGVRF